MKHHGSYGQSAAGLLASGLFLVPAPQFEIERRPPGHGEEHKPRTEHQARWGLRTLLGESVHVFDDVDGDGTPDVLATCRHDNSGALDLLYCLSGADGETLWSVARTRGWLSRSAVIGDVDGDGLRDLIATFPGGEVDLNVAYREIQRGEVRVLSGADGSRLRVDRGAEPIRYLNNSDSGIFAVADHDGDDVDDYIVAAEDDGAVALLRSGADGTVLRSYRGPDDLRVIGSSLASLGDIDADHVEDFVFGTNRKREPAGALVLSGDSGHLLGRIDEPFGAAVCALGDVDGDGVIDWATSSVDTAGLTDDWLPYSSEVLAVSGAKGAILWRLERPDSLWYAYFGVALRSVEDLDGDGCAELAIGCEADLRFSRDGPPGIWIVSGRTGITVRHLPIDQDPTAGTALDWMPATVVEPQALVVGAAFQCDNPWAETAGFVGLYDLDGSLRWAVHGSDLFKR